MRPPLGAVSHRHKASEWLPYNLAVWAQLLIPHGSGTMGERRQTGQLFLLSSHFRRQASWYTWPCASGAPSLAAASAPVPSEAPGAGGLPSVAPSSGAPSVLVPFPVQICTTQPLLPSASTPSEQMGQHHEGSSTATRSTLTSRRSSASHQATRESSRPERASTSSRPISKMATTVRVADWAMKSATNAGTVDRGVRMASNGWLGCSTLRRAWQAAQRS
mmetsp:Transcript_96462/g.281919  ORF Transcript_96462/g.281919 Transcript_96462/m.281919 type:complete len:219 (+) Transcript_96462:380-1036(+)